MPRSSVRGRLSGAGEGESVHLDGIQGQVEHSTLLWSEIPCFLPHHVVLEPRENSIRKAQGSHKCSPLSSQFKNSSHIVVLSPTSGPQAPSLQPHGPHIIRTLSLESWLSSLAAVKISWVPWAERDQSKAEDCKLYQEVGSKGKETVGVAGRVGLLLSGQ